MNGKGFTLVELMIGVAIIGIFAAFLLPIISGGVPSSSPTPAEVNAANWECVNWESKTEMVIDGNVMVPETKNVCVEYKRKEASNF